VISGDLSALLHYLAVHRIIDRFNQEGAGGRRLEKTA
jgi:hypothetical protein